MTTELPRYVLVLLFLFLVGCGSSSTSTSLSPTPSTPPNQAKVVDPSGNWVMTATDESGSALNMAAVFSQTGDVVTLTSNAPGFAATTIYVPLPPASFTCNPPVGAPGAGSMIISLSNGLVQNTNQFTGEFDFSNFSVSQNARVSLGAMQFITTLSADATSFTGTFSGMPACSGIGATGTFTGQQLTPVTGTWNGTAEACDYQGTLPEPMLATFVPTAGCPTEQNATADALTFTLSQNDALDFVQGSFQAGVTGLAAGTVLAGQLSGTEDAWSFPDALLTGYVMQLVVQDSATGNMAVLSGQLNGTGGFTGLLWVHQNGQVGQDWYAVTMTQQSQ